MLFKRVITVVVLQPWKMGGGAFVVIAVMVLVVAVILIPGGAIVFELSIKKKAIK